ncbi:hypothetical protein PV326_012678 [Microctonus aethiopoides]|nr:hypothetical protein PV326_012678 [Microctonus aethiopoides]
MCNMKKLLIFIGIIAVTVASNITRVDKDEKPYLVCKIGFSYYRTISSEISLVIESISNPMAYFLIDIKKYANSYDEFVRKYPSVTIKTKGEAMSFSTFGDVGKNKFGALKYATDNFWMNNSVHYVDFLNTFDAKWGAYYVRVTIGIGFVRQDTKLYLIPYSAGRITSHGFLRRHLKFGFRVDTLTFNPYLDIGSLTTISSERWAVGKHLFVGDSETNVTLVTNLIIF